MEYSGFKLKKYSLGLSYSVPCYLSREFDKVGKSLRHLRDTEKESKGQTPTGESLFKGQISKKMPIFLIGFWRDLFKASIQISVSEIIDDENTFPASSNIFFM